MQLKQGGEAFNASNRLNRQYSNRKNFVGTRIDFHQRLLVVEVMHFGFQMYMRILALFR